MDQLMKELKIYKPGAMSKAAKVELLLKTLEYSQDKIAKILAGMKAASKPDARGGERNAWEGLRSCSAE